MKTSASVIQRRGSWCARVRFIDTSTGQLREISKAFTSKSAARQQKDAWLRELDESGSQSLQKSRTTFAEFASWFRENYLVPAVYSADGQKVHGLRSLRSAVLHFRVVTAHFGKHVLRDIRHADLRAFRLQRLQTPKRGGGGRT